MTEQGGAGESTGSWAGNVEKARQTKDVDEALLKLQGGGGGGVSETLLVR